MLFENLPDSLGVGQVCHYKGPPPDVCGMTHAQIVENDWIEPHLGQCLGCVTADVSGAPRNKDIHRIRFYLLFLVPNSGARLKSMTECWCGPRALRVSMMSAETRVAQSKAQ